MLFQSFFVQFKVPVEGDMRVFFEAESMSHIFCALEQSWFFFNKFISSAFVR